MCASRPYRDDDRAEKILLSLKDSEKLFPDVADDVKHIRAVLSCGRNDLDTLYSVFYTQRRILNLMKSGLVALTIFRSPERSRSESVKAFEIIRWFGIS